MFATEDPEKDWASLLKNQFRNLRLEVDSLGRPAKPVGGACLAARFSQLSQQNIGLGHLVGQLKKTTRAKPFEGLLP